MLEQKDFLEIKDIAKELMLKLQKITIIIDNKCDDEEYELPQLELFQKFTNRIAENITFLKTESNYLYGNYDDVFNNYKDE